MHPDLRTAWRIARRRAVADRITLGAAFITVLLATTVLAAGPLYADAVTEASLHRALDDAPVGDANLQLTGSVPTTGDPAASFRDLDARVVDDVGRALGGVPATVHRSLLSGTFALPGQDEVTDLVRFVSYDGLEEHATLVAGGWPEAGSEPPAVAVPRAAAADLGLAPGDELPLAGRRPGAPTLTVAIAGVYEVDDRADPFWFGHRLELDGADPGGSFTIHGPLAAPGELVLGPIADSGLTARWRVEPASQAITVDDLGSLRRGIGGLRGGSGDDLSLQTGLPVLLAGVERSLLVTRSAVVVATVQLAVLAGYALLFTAGLIIEQRRVEMALLNARGAAPGQVAGAALVEALALGVPAALLGPLLALLAVGALDRFGPLAAIGLDLDLRLRPLVFAIAAAAALACALVLTVPAARAARTYAEARAARGRGAVRGVAWRSGADLALVLLAALGYWQLRRYGAPITRSVHGRLGLDPFLVLAPTLGLLAGALLSLRFLPRLAALAERRAAARADVVPSLGAWQLARRPARHARATLLVVLALGVSLFAVSYAHTWSRSQRDQADHRAGADVRVDPDRRPGTSVPTLVQAEAHRHVAGVEAVMAAATGSVRVGSTPAAGTVLALDAEHAAEVVRLRPDLAPLPPQRLFAPLADTAPNVPAVAVPGEPARLLLDVTAQLGPAADGSTAPGLAAGGGDQPLGLVVRDGSGLVHHLLTERFPADGRRRTLSVDLAAAVGPDERTPRYPLDLLGVEVRLQPGLRARTATVTIHEVRTGPADARVALTPADWRGVVVPLPEARSAPGLLAVAASADQGVSVEVELGSTVRPTTAAVTYRLVPGPPPGGVALAVIATGAFLDASGLVVGDRAELELQGQRQAVEVVAAVEAFPTLDPLVPAVIVDLPAYAQQRFATDGSVVSPSAWWLDVRAGATSEVAAALVAPPFTSAAVVDREDLARSLLSDPVALGVLGALLLGSVAATAVAAIGFAVAAVVSARERVGEFALIRALGLSGRQLSGWLTFENGTVVAAGIVGGTALGLGLAWLILPLVSLTPAATAPVPAAIFDIPWSTVVGVEAVVVALLAIVVIATASGLRRLALATVIRFGEER